MWVFRLFAVDDADSPLGSQRLHFVPVPSGIPRDQWLFTSLRIRHGGSLTATHRRARREKYREADPRNEFQDDYETLLLDPEPVSPWTERPAGLPVLLGREGRYVDRQLEAGCAGHDRPAGCDEPTPAISAVVIARDDAPTIEASVRALVDQHVDEPFEVIVVGSGTDDTVARAAAVDPSVRTVQLPLPALPGEARNAGLWMARGEFVTFPGSHIRLEPGSLAARLAAHDDGWQLVTGSVRNGNPTRAGWASYFLDHAAQTPSRASGPFDGVPGHASYVTADVRRVGGFPQDMRAGEDTVVNRRLHLDGARAWFASEATFVHASRSTTLGHLLRHHLERGRGHGRILRDAGRRRRQLPGDAFRSTRRRLRYLRAATAQLDAPLARQERRVHHLVLAGAVAAGAGTTLEALPRRPRPVSTGPVTVTQPGGVSHAGEGAPWLVLSGRPGEAPSGLLAGGSARQAAERVATLARYAATVGPVRGALAPIVTSATVTHEAEGTNTLDLAASYVDAYRQAAADRGVTLLLQLQPGRAPLVTLLERWAEVLDAPDVGVLLDLRPPLATAGQLDELVPFAEALRATRRRAPILVRGAVDLPPGVLPVEQVHDLRRPGTPFPHEVWARPVVPGVVLYH